MFRELSPYPNNPSKPCADDQVLALQKDETYQCTPSINNCNEYSLYGDCIGCASNHRLLHNGQCKLNTMIIVFITLSVFVVVLILAICGVRYYIKKKKSKKWGKNKVAIEYKPDESNKDNENLKK